MGKKRNRKMKIVYCCIDDDMDFLKLTPGDAEPSKDGQSLQMKAEAIPLGYGELQSNTLEVNAFGSSVSTGNSTKRGFSPDGGSSHQNGNIHKTDVTKTEKGSFSTSKTSCPPRQARKSAPGIPPLKAEGTGLENIQQMTELSVSRVMNTISGDVGKDEPEISAHSNESFVQTLKPYEYGKSLRSNTVRTKLALSRLQDFSDLNSQNFGSRCDSPVQSQTESARGGISHKSSSSAKYYSAKVGTLAEISSAPNKKNSQPLTVARKSDTGNQRNSIESFQGTQAMAKCIPPVPFKTGNGSGCDAMEEPAGFGSLQFKESCDKSLVHWESGNKVNYARFNSMRSSPVAENPTRNWKKHFQKALDEWLPVRNQSIKALEKLCANAKSNEAFYDNIQLNCKYGSISCKMGKVHAQSWTWELLTSLGSTFCDVAGGMTSVAHMFSTDSVQYQFQETMDRDEAATKKMYAARSKYIEEYQYIEEIIRKFGGTTVGETLGKISEAIGITEFFQKMKKANDNREDIVLAAVSAIGDIIGRNCYRNVAREVVDAVEELVDSNPACVETVIGVGKSLYGAVDLRMVPIKRAGKAGALVKSGTNLVDMALVHQDQNGILELERKMKMGSPSALLKRVQQALDMFVQERNEMLDLLSKL